MQCSKCVMYIMYIYDIKIVGLPGSELLSTRRISRYGIH